MNRPLSWRLAALPLMAVLSLVGAAAAGAHEPRTSGGFRFVVGWGEEPAYSGLRNSVQVIVSDANGSPVTNLEGSLQVEVTKGSEKLALALEPASGTPGDYRASVTPTRPGTYAIRLFGTVRSQNVDETFTSGNGTFNDVEDAGTIQFPAKDPSPGEVAARLDRQLPRLESDLRAAEDRADQARTLAAVSGAVAVLSLVVAAFAVIAARRRSHRSVGSATTPDTVQAGTRQR